MNRAYLELRLEILRLRLDMLSHEERDYARGMRGMCEVRCHSPEDEADRRVIRSIYDRRHDLIGIIQYVEFMLKQCED